MKKKKCSEIKEKEVAINAVELTPGLTRCRLPGKARLKERRNGRPPIPFPSHSFINSNPLNTLKERRVEVVV